MCFYLPLVPNLSEFLKAKFETHELLIIVVHGKYIGLISEFFKINQYFEFRVLYLLF
jgi:hypothetical protein